MRRTSKYLNTIEIPFEGSTPATSAWSKSIVIIFLSTLLVWTFPGYVFAKGNNNTHEMSPNARKGTFDKSFFKPDPVYKAQPYDAKAQRAIYGNKRAVNTTQSFFEVGRPYLQAGPYKPGNPYRFMIYGDFQTGVGLNQFDDQSQQVLGLRASLDLDLKLTSTGRLHALIRPFDTANQPSQIRLDDEEEGRGFVHIYQHCLENECSALESFDEVFGNFFFEGEIANLPIALGKIPHLVQNGVWLEDAYIGGAISWAAQNSKTLDIPNFDISLIGGLMGMDDRVFGGATQNGVDGSFVATTIFADGWGGYLEAGYGLVIDRGSDKRRAVVTTDPRFAGGSFKGDLGYHNLTAAFTKRYGALISNSVRFIANVGQEKLSLRNKPDIQTANGFALLIENSLITTKPLTFVPYFNFFVGVDSPQALSRQFGLLRNTGLLFENNALTGQQAFFDNPDDSIGGAVGLEYLFNLDQQIVIEAAGSASICRDREGKNSLGNRCRRGSVAGNAVRDQAGVGFRYQLPFGLIRRAWILRADGSYGKLFQDNGSKEFFSARLELRRKF